MKLNSNTSTPSRKLVDYESSDEEIQVMESLSTPKPTHVPVKVEENV